MSSRMQLADFIRQNAVIAGSWRRNGYTTQNWVCIDHILGDANGRRLLLSTFRDRLADCDCGICCAEEDAALGVFLAAAQGHSCFSMPRQGMSGWEGSRPDFLGTLSGPQDSVMIVTSAISSGATVKELLRFVNRLERRVLQVVAVVDMSPNRDDMFTFCVDNNCLLTILLEAADIGVQPVIPPPTLAHDTQERPTGVESRRTDDVSVA